MSRQPTADAVRAAILDGRDFRLANTWFSNGGPRKGFAVLLRHADGRWPALAESLCIGTHDGEADTFVNALRHVADWLDGDGPKGIVW